jgi:hypothetical protein
MNFENNKLHLEIFNKKLIKCKRDEQWLKIWIIFDISPKLIKLKKNNKFKN